MLNKIIHIITILLGFPIFVFSKNEMPAPITIVHFQTLKGGIILVKATLDAQQDSLNFIFDTGSGGISIDSTTAIQLHLNVDTATKILNGIGGRKKVQLTNHHQLHFPGLVSANLDFHINNYDALSASHGIKIDGIIGYSFIKNYIIHINFNLQQLSIFSNTTVLKPKKAFCINSNFSTIPYLQATVANATSNFGNFIFDTGGGLCMLLSESYVRDHHLLPAKRKLYPTIAEGIGGKQNMNITYLKKVKIGAYTFKKVPVYIFNDEYGIIAYPFLGGLIGGDLLRRFNIILNYAQQRIYLEPNLLFSEPFDYSYTGMNFYQENGNVYVGEIVKDSPADIAGLKFNDLIITMNDLMIDDMQTLKTALQKTDRRMITIIKRENQTRCLTLKVGNILK